MMSSLFIIVTGRGRWLFELEPATEEQSARNLNHIRIAGEFDDDDGHNQLNQKDNIYQLADKTNHVDLLFVDSITGPRIVEDIDMSWGSYASPYHKLSHRYTGRVLIKVLKQEDPVGIAFERKIKNVYRIQ